MFKVGDRVRRKNYKNHIGTVFSISDDLLIKIDWDVDPGWWNSENNSFQNPNDFELIKTEKYKEDVMIYLMDNGDQLLEFDTIDELKTRIEELIFGGYTVDQLKIFKAQKLNLNMTVVITE